MKRKIFALLIVVAMISGILPLGVSAAEKYPWVWYDYSESTGDPTAQGCTVSLAENDGVGTKKGALKVNVLSKNGTPVYSGITLEQGVKYRFSAWIKVSDIELAITKPTFSFVLFTKQAASSSNGYNILEGDITDFKQGEWVYVEKIWTCTGTHDAGGAVLDMTAGSSLNFRFGNRNDNWTNVNNSQTYSYYMDDFRIEPVYDVAQSNIEVGESLRNADFETGFNEAFWSIEDKTQVTEISGAASTKKAVLLSGGSWGIKQRTQVEENAIYKLGFWAKAGSDDSVGAKAFVNIDFSDLDNMTDSDRLSLPTDSIDKADGSFVLTDDWKHYECSFVNSTVTGYDGMPYLYFTQSGGALDMAVDEITLEKSDELVCDGEFLSGTAFWNTDNVTAETVYDDAPEGYNGNVLKITETANNGTITQAVPILGGKTYKIGFWAKGLSWKGSDETLKTIVTFDRTVTDKDFETLSDEALTLGKTWQYFEYEYTPDSDEHNTDVMPKVGLKFKIGRSGVSYLLAGFTITEKTSGQGGGENTFSGLDYLIASGKMITGETITVSGKYVGDGAPSYIVRTFVSENTRGYVLENYSFVDGDFDLKQTVSEEMVGRSFKFEAVPLNGSGEKVKQVVTGVAEPLFEIKTKCTGGFDGDTISFVFDIVNNRSDCDLVVMLAQYDEDMEMLSLKELYKPVAKYGELLGQSISDGKAPTAASAKLMVWKGVSSTDNSSVSYASHIIERQ